MRGAGFRVQCRRLAVIVTLLGFLAVPASIAESQSAPEVDLALVLAVDCSYSVDNAEFRLQMDGLAKAFQDPKVTEAIAKGPLGRIAVTLFQWSSENSQKITVSWSIIDSPSTALAFAAQIQSAVRQTADGATSISAAVSFGTELIETSPLRPLRRVIDVSADGGNNNGRPAEDSRDEALDRGITINGLTIINEVPYLDKYFERHVTGGPGTFVIVANDYEAYREAILKKLILEILGPTVS